MKKITTISLLLAGSVVSSYGVTLSGTAAINATNFAAGNSSFVIVDTAGDGLDFSTTSVGAVLSAGAFFGNDYIASYNDVVSAFGAITINGAGIIDIESVSNNVDAGDTFFIVAFGSQSGDNITVQAGDTFDILAGGNWQLPSANGATLDYNAGIAQIDGANGSAFTVVPEPSSYAALAGVLALGCVVARRRS
ncbi:MAG: PEP-CTERM sorting domain-containing protein [Opitutaceae bacterium]